jgi:hypothetical protein
MIVMTALAEPPSDALDEVAALRVSIFSKGVVARFRATVPPPLAWV